jgi:hypothetical protein
VDRNRYINQDNKVSQTGSKCDRHRPGPVDVFCAVLPTNRLTGPGLGRSKNGGVWVRLSFSRLATQPIGPLGGHFSTSLARGRSTLLASWCPKIVRPAPGEADRIWGCEMWWGGVGGEVCLTSGDKSQTGSNIDRPPARQVEFLVVRSDGVERVVRVDGVHCLDTGRQKSQTESKVDRPPARQVEYWGVRFDGVEWVVRFDGVQCPVEGGKRAKRNQNLTGFRRGRWKLGV